MCCRVLQFPGLVLRLVEVSVTNKVKEGVYGLAITQIELVVPRSLARVASSAEGAEEVLGGEERSWSNFRE